MPSRGFKASVIWQYTQYASTGLPPSYASCEAVRSDAHDEVPKRQCAEDVPEAMRPHVNAEMPAHFGGVACKEDCYRQPQDAEAGPPFEAHPPRQNTMARPSAFAHTTSPKTKRRIQTPYAATSEGLLSRPARHSQPQQAPKSCSCTP